MLSPALSARETATGTRTVTVPTLVPMDMEMRDAMMNMPGTAMLPGRSSSRKFAVLAAPPAAFAMPPNMPANRKMKIMMVMLSSPMPLAQRWIF